MHPGDVVLVLVLAAVGAALLTFAIRARRRRVRGLLIVVSFVYLLSVGGVMMFAGAGAAGEPAGNVYFVLSLVFYAGALGALVLSLKAPAAPGS
jgi:hypothetical protein